MNESGDLLVAAPERWDEACFAVPAMRALAASGLRVGVLCREEQQEFWQTVPELRPIPVSRQSKSRQLAAAIRNAWQAALVWEAGWAADAIKLAAVPRILGPAEGKLARRLTHPLACRTTPTDHRVRFYLAAAGEMGVDTSRPEFFAPVTVGVESVPEAVLLCPDSDFGASHEWPLDRWEEVARRLQETGRRVTIAGLPGGRDLGRTLASGAGLDDSFFEARPLAGALPLLAVHGLVVAADGSLPHLAAHVGAVCVTLFGPNDAAWKRPLGRRHRVVKQHTECAPCLMARCPLDSRCQRELDIDRVWAAIQT